MKASWHAHALALIAIATAAAPIGLFSAVAVAEPLPFTGKTLHRPIKRPLPFFMPNSRPTIPHGQSRFRTMPRPADSVAAPHRDSSNTDTSTPSANVVIAGMRFQPALIHIKAGGQVTWTNHEPIVHIISSPDHGLLASDQLMYGTTFTHTFKEPGVYNYYCTLNRAMMGVVIVR